MRSTWKSPHGRQAFAGNQADATIHAAAQRRMGLALFYTCLIVTASLYPFAPGQQRSAMVGLRVTPGRVTGQVLTSRPTCWATR